MKKLVLTLIYGIASMALGADEYTIQTISALKEESITPAFEKKVKKSALPSQKIKEGTCNIVTVGHVITSYSIHYTKLYDFPAPCYYDWAYNYQKATKTRVNYQAIGSGGGIKQISERIVDFGGTDAPMTPKELDKAKLLQFPAVIGSIVSYNFV